MKTNYRRFTWFTTDLVARVVEVLRENPAMGRNTLSKTTGLSMYESEHTLVIWRDYDLYALLDTEDPVEAIAERLELHADPNDEVTEPGLEEDGADDHQWDTPSRYYYDTKADLYLVTLMLRGKPRTVKIPGEMHRAMREAYSDWDGDRQTLNRVAKRFGVSRLWFHAYKAAMGWTHDSDPFSDEEVAAVDPEELAARAVQRRRFVIEKSFDRQREEADRKDAAKFRELERLVIEPLIEDLVARLPALAKEVGPDLVSEVEHPFALVVSPTDLHFGKLSAEGTVADPYNRELAKRRLEDGTRDLLEHVAYHGRPEEIISAMASDWFHVDNVHGATTKGTRQDVDGHVWQMISQGVDLALWFVETLRHHTDKVRLLVVRGNHDSFSSLFLLKTLQVRYAGIWGVEIIDCVRPRTYVDYGKTLMGFTHGEHWKKDMVQKILVEPDRDLLYRTSERVWFTGHKHHEESKDYGGVRWYQLPSLSGDDAWHDEMGYSSSRKSLAGYIVRRDQGVVAQIYAPTTWTLTDLKHERRRS